VAKMSTEDHKTMTASESPARAAKKYLSIDAKYRKRARNLDVALALVSGYSSRVVMVIALNGNASQVFLMYVYVLLFLSAQALILVRMSRRRPVPRSDRTIAWLLSIWVPIAVIVQWSF
jgi:hypothetical protein